MRSIAFLTACLAIGTAAAQSRDRTGPDRTALIQSGTYARLDPTTQTFRVSTVSVTSE